MQPYQKMKYPAQMTNSTDFRAPKPRRAYSEFCSMKTENM